MGSDIYEKAEGRVVDAVLTHDKETVSVTFQDGSSLVLGLDGDCCSRSYFTDTTQFEELVGSTIHSIEERDGESANAPAALTTDSYETDCVRWHFLVFITSRGHVTIDWRNDSNGYYDGTVRPRFEEAS